MKIACCGLIALALSASPASADTLWWGCHNGGEDYANCGKSFCNVGHNMTFRIERGSDATVIAVYDYQDQDTGEFGPYARPTASRGYRVYPNRHLALDNDGRILRYAAGDLGRYLFDLRQGIFRIESYTGNGQYRNTDFVCQDIEPLQG